MLQKYSGSDQYTRQYNSPLGTILLACDNEGLIGLWFEGQKYFASILDKTAAKKDSALFKEPIRWLDMYFAGKNPGFTPPLHFLGTAFQKDVWRLLLAIPYGETVTYGDIAMELTREKNLSHVSARAIGGAVARNTISIIVPCHRVVGANGSLTGYAGGIDKKRALLAFEKPVVAVRTHGCTRVTS